MRPTTTLLLLLLVLTLVGCLEATDHTTVRPDGSGTVTIRYEVDLVKFKELMERSTMLFPQASAGMPKRKEAPNLIARGWAEKAAAAAEGYQIKKFEESTTETKRTTVVEATFKTLLDAAKGGAFPVSSVLLQRVPAPEGEGDGELERPSWKLTFRPAWSTAGQAMGGRMDPSAILRMFQAQLKGMKVIRSLTLPTAILRTNGKKSEDGKTVQWSVNYADVLAGKDPEPWVVFQDSSSWALEPFKHDVKLMAMAERLHRDPPKADGGQERGGKQGDGDPGREDK